jgi:hypothetical protein
MRGAEFTLIASAIRKHEHRARYAEPPHPYHTAMGFGLERVYLELRGRGCREGTTNLLFERRGGKEDAELEAEFERICARNATGAALPFNAVMCDKRCNSAGCSWRTWWRGRSGAGYWRPRSRTAPTKSCAPSSAATRTATPGGGV